MRLKKKWSKAELRRVRVSDQFDPANGLTRVQWAAARKLQRQNEDAGKKANNDAGARH